MLYFIYRRVPFHVKYWNGILSDGRFELLIIQYDKIDCQFLNSSKKNPITLQEQVCNQN